MTLQQLKYIVAIDRYRNFAKAAESCGISQPTLSAMLVKLEEELDVRIFERSNKSVAPTANGAKIIRQAERAIAEAERITWLVNEEKGSVSGELSLSVGPTIAPYILPKFIRHYVEDYPVVKLSVKEMKADMMLSELLLGHLDAGIAISGNTRQAVAGSSRCRHCHQREHPSRGVGDTALHREVHGLSGRELLAETSRVQARESGA